ncbi:MAG: sulfur carrier protein ThiS adenylyltransferase ThiF [Bacteroidales bacterium]|nr:sulfur carrier protein ThiS adenylyltransferase ThiF [Bacteroidales bacterium]
MTATEIRRRLAQKTVGVAGCGGLGSNAAMALARIGLKHFVLVDFDVVEESNLNRQYYFRNQLGEKKVKALSDNMLAVDCSLSITAWDMRLEADKVKEIFAGCDLIIEAFDRAESKQMLAESVMSCLSDKILIMGLGMAGVGKSELIRQEQWDEQVYVCGDLVSEIDEELPPLAPRVGIVANMQANLALELLLRE